MSYKSLFNYTVYLINYGNAKQSHLKDIPHVPLEYLELELPGLHEDLAVLEDI